MNFVENKIGKKRNSKKNDKISDRIVIPFKNYYTNIDKDGIIRHYKLVNDKSSKFWSIGFINKEGWVLKLDWGKFDLKEVMKGKKSPGKMTRGESVKDAQSKLDKKIVEGYIPIGISFDSDISNIISPSKRDTEIFEKYKYQVLTKQNKRTNKVKSGGQGQLRKDRIKYLTKYCKESYDDITKEKFEEWDDEDLKDAVLIGPTNDKTCYKVSSIYKWIIDFLTINNISPLIINSHEITEEEMEEIYKKLTHAQIARIREVYRENKRKAFEKKKKRILNFFVDD